MTTPPPPPFLPVDTAAVSWVGGDGTNHVRVFISNGYTVIERRWDGAGWTTGSFNAPGSQVSATAWVVGGQGYVRVYCTFEDKIVEWGADADSDSYWQGSFTLS